MGASVSVELRLDKTDPTHVYTRDAPITGALIVINKSTKKATMLQSGGRVSVQGRIRTEVIVGRGAKQDSYTEDDSFWKIGSERDQWLIPARTKVPPGRNVYPFSYELPAGCPSSNKMSSAGVGKISIEYVLRCGCPPQTKDIVKTIQVQGRPNFNPTLSRSISPEAQSFVGVGIVAASPGDKIPVILYSKSLVEDTDKKLDYVKVELLELVKATATGNGFGETKSIFSKKITRSELQAMKVGDAVAELLISYGTLDSVMSRLACVQHLVRIRSTFVANSSGGVFGKGAKKSKPYLQVIHVQPRGKTRQHGDHGTTVGPVLAEPPLIRHVGGGAAYYQDGNGVPATAMILGAMGLLESLL